MSYYEGAPPRQPRQKKPPRKKIVRCPDYMGGGKCVLYRRGERYQGHRLSEPIYVKVGK